MKGIKVLKVIKSEEERLLIESQKTVKHKQKKDKKKPMEKPTEKWREKHKVAPQMTEKQEKPKKWTDNARLMLTLTLCKTMMPFDRTYMIKQIIL